MTHVHLTELAAKKVADLISSELASGREGEIVLRIGVRGGGCSGFNYALALDEPRPDDARYEEHGVPVAVSADAVAYVSGSTLDFVDTLAKSGFQFDNPNAKSSCGCGESFRVDDQEGCDATSAI